MVPNISPKRKLLHVPMPKIFDPVYIKNRNFAADHLAFNLLSETMHLLKIEMHKGISVSHIYLYKSSFAYNIYMHV